MVQNDPVEDRATKRKLGTEEETQKAESEVAEKKDDSKQMLSKMFDKPNQKDQQISQMLATIEGLRIEIRTFNGRFAQMQPNGTDEDKDI